MNKKIIPYDEPLRGKVQAYANKHTNGNSTKAILALVNSALLLDDDSVTVTVRNKAQGK